MYASKVKRSESDDTTTTVLAVLIAPFLMVIGAMANGFLVKTYWTWFVLSIFRDLPELTIAQGIGIAVFVSLFTPTHSNKDDESSAIAQLVKAIVYVIVRFVIFLVYGWVVYQFI